MLIRCHLQGLEDDVVVKSKRVFSSAGSKCMKEFVFHMIQDATKIPHA